MTAAGLGLWAAITIAVAGPATSTEYLPLHVAQVGRASCRERVSIDV